MDALAGQHGDCLKDYLTKATTDSLTKGRALGDRNGHAGYGYQFRTDLKDSPKSAFKMQGFMGQHVIFDPDSGKVVIGFSHTWDEEIQTLFSAWTRDRQAAFPQKSPNHFWKGLINLVAWDGIEPSQTPGL